MRYRLISRAAPLLLAAQAVAQQIPDPEFDTKITNPAFTTTRPVVLFDEAHHNEFTTKGRSLKFVELLTSDGYRVVANREKFSRKALSGADVLVIAAPKGRTNDATADASAFTPEEIEALYQWVHGGGGALLLTADHHPFDAAAQSLANRFGVTLSVGVVGDSANYDRTSANPSLAAGRTADQWIVFTHENRLLREHAILRGRNESERIRGVLTQGGSSLIGPAGGTEFLALSPTATNRPRAGKGGTGLGRAEAVAFQIGKGRVVVLADATMFTAQWVREAQGREPFRLGMSRSDFDNRQLALSVMHWLSGVLR